MSRLFALFAILLVLGCSASNKKPASSAKDEDDSSQLKSWDSDKDDAEGDSDSEESSSPDSNDGKKPGINYVSESKLPPGPSCLDQQGNVQECLSDKDCCKDFYCGLDPEGNTRVKVCLYGGK